MSILSDRRTLREIGGVRAYLTQVGWSIWWRTQSGAQPSHSRDGRRAPVLAEAERRRVTARSSRRPAPPTA